MQWDSTNGFTTWFTKQLPTISAETQELLDLFNDDSLKEMNNSELRDFFTGLNGVTEEFLNFTDTVDSSGNILEQYKEYLNSTVNATSRFAGITKKAVPILKSIVQLLALWQ